MFSIFELKQQFFEYWRTQACSQSVIDKIYCDIKCNLLTSKALYNTMSDHDAQILSCDHLSDVHTVPIKNQYKKT